MAECIKQPSLPVFHQFVSHRLFKEVVKGKFLLPESGRKDPQTETSPITELEENAIRYIAGYVCRKVQKTLLSSNLPLKEDMILFMSDFTGQESDETKESEQWINAIDRGGLYHVSDDIFTIFYFMEEECRKHFTTMAAKKLDESSKEKVMGAMLTNEDLQLRWKSLSSTVDDNISVDILKRIVNLYLTVRGFAFTSSIMELYKRKHRKKTQKSKALRKTLAI